jgi:hypothetical protein
MPFLCFLVALYEFERRPSFVLPPSSRDREKRSREKDEEEPPTRADNT